MTWLAIAILAAGALLGAGIALRAALPLLRRLFIPGSAVAGFLGFAVVQIGIRADPRHLESAYAKLANEWRSWPTWLIAVVFAGMLLERPALSFRQSLRRAAAEGVVVWIIIVGQVVLGFATAWLVLQPIFGTPIAFGQLLEVSWAGGFGSSAAWGTLHERIGAMPDARDLGVFFAVAGLLWGVVSGIVLVNIAARRGWVRPRGTGVSPVHAAVGDCASPTRAGRPWHAVVQPLILGAAFASGFGLKWCVNRAAGAIDPSSLTFVDNLPLFMFTLIGGLIVREILHAAKLGWLIDPLSLRRIVGVAMEFVIVSALASMRLSSLVAYGLPSLILMIVGAAWCAFTLIWLSRRLLPREYWFELGVINYGMATAATPQGMMLLRMIDKDLESGAAEDYALAAPLSAPFVGGGVITMSLPILLQHTHVGWVIGCGAVVTAALYVVGRRWIRSRAFDNPQRTLEIHERAT